MNKPNQVIDEIFDVVYPPAEAILPQLYTIKTLAVSTAKVYEATDDIHSILPNLDMIQRAVDYLRGAPMQDELKPEPDEIMKPTFILPTVGFNVVTNINKDGEYDISILGLNVEQMTPDKELFGDIDEEVVEMRFEIPVTCGKTYLVSQENPVLKYYYDRNDPSIFGGFGTYIKEKEYLMDEDNFAYAFLLPKGRSKVRIAICADYEEPIIFKITSHIHFKQEEKENDA